MKLRRISDQRALNLSFTSKFISKGIPLLYNPSSTQLKFTGGKSDAIVYLAYKYSRFFNVKCDVFWERTTLEIIYDRFRILIRNSTYNVLV